LEHTITDPACDARPTDVETGDLLQAIVGLDVSFVAGDPVIRGVMTRHLRSPNGGLVLDENNEPMAHTEEVEIIYIDGFDQSRVANSE